MSKKSKFKAPKQKPWKKHKQVLVSTTCGVRVEVDKGIASLIRILNMHGVETRHSCEGRKPFERGYVSMFATPVALGLGHYLLEHGGKAHVYLERDVHPNGYENLTIRWPKKKLSEFETLVHTYFYGKQ